MECRELRRASVIHEGRISVFREGTRPEAAALIEFVDSHRVRFGIEPVCAVLGFPVSSYYFAKKREAEPTARDSSDATLKEKIMAVWKGEKGREVYGARKVWLELNMQGEVVARCTVERLMRELGIAGRRSGAPQAAADDGAGRSRQHAG